ncbi:hypothetical protein PV08_07726 [Exophiala spinifera]|uniref:Uncharacterized protein n=1 Tax=Exophiala spinifera TaxID=91928 RepID=A0A0D2BUM8_9EURO|nr:uncharacterized protein PV08_07726 [Exophiala spinifera]KIW14939.1 hypothetical protein PV08_07726 [Exophiala spinifera]
MFGNTKPASDRTDKASEGPVHLDPSFWNSARKWTFPKSQDESNNSRWTSYKEQQDPHPGDQEPSSRMASSHTGSIIGQHVLVLLAFSLPVVAFGLVLSIPQWRNVRPEYWDNIFGHCNYNGNFTLNNKPTLSLWDRSGFLIINVAWGSMSFSAAKGLDIVWDIMVGRAGQAILAWATFKVSSQYLDLAMREEPVSYGTFEALAFVPPSLVRTARLAMDLVFYRSWSSRLAILWIICSSLFVLSFSSLASAMSGYNTNSEAVVTDSRGQAANFADYRMVQFAIHDAWRIGEPEPIFITTGGACVRKGFNDDDGKEDDDDNDTGTDQVITSYTRRDPEPQSGAEEEPFEYVPINCTMFWRTVQYVGLNGADGTSNKSSTFIFSGTRYNLSSPTLNITTSYTTASLEKLTSYLNNFHSTSTTSLKSLGEPSRSAIWIYENNTYSYDYVLDHTTCQYERSHNWGFSFLLLLLTTLILMIWALGTYGMWLYIQTRNPWYAIRSVGERHNPGGRGIYRSSWDLVEAMKKDLGSEAVVPDMSEKEIRHLLRRRNVAFNCPFHGVIGRDTLCQAPKAANGVGAAVRRRTQWKRLNQWLHSLLNRDQPAISVASQQPVLKESDYPSGTVSTLGSWKSSSVLTFSNQIAETE